MIGFYFACDFDFVSKKMGVGHLNMEREMYPPQHLPLMKIRVGRFLVFIVGEKAVPEKLTEGVHAGFVASRRRVCVCSWAPGVALSEEDKLAAFVAIF